MQFELAPFALPADYGDSIVSLADMKAHLNVIEDDDDALIGIYRDAAVDMVERYCGLRLAPCTGLVWRGESLTSPLRLGVGPVTAITGVTWLDGAGESVTRTAGDWRIMLRDQIALMPGRTAPDNVAAGVIVTFNAGYAGDERPAALVQAVKLFAAHLYMNREAVSAGTLSGEIPLGFRVLCGQYRVPVI